MTHYKYTESLLILDIKKKLISTTLNLIIQLKITVHVMLDNDDLTLLKLYINYSSDDRVLTLIILVN